MQPLPRPRRRAWSILMVGALALAALPAGGLATAATAAGSTAAVDGSAAKKGGFRPPVKGKWTIDDTGLSGGFKIKGKAKPKIVKLTITVLDEDGPRGADCAPPGTTLKVQGAIKLKKGKKFAKSANSFGHWWLIAQRDGKYDTDTYYNYMGVKPLRVKVAVGRAAPVDMLLAGYWDANVPPKKQRITKFTLIDPAPGGGWCRYDPYMFTPAKK